MNVNTGEQKSIEWYRRAAEQGDTDAQVHLAECLENGIGLEKNEEEAYKWYRTAAELGHAQAQRSMGDHFFGENNREAARWFEQAAKQGDANAQHKLALCYLRIADLYSRMGFAYAEKIATYEKKAMWWYRIAAKKLGPRVQVQLGGYLMCCKGFEKEAAEWFQKAAEVGDPMGQFSLAECYEKGVGVEVDEQTAIHWYQKAAEQGLSPAQRRVDAYLSAGCKFTDDAKRRFLP